MVEKKVDEKTEKFQNFAETVSTTTTTVWQAVTGSETYLTLLIWPTKSDFFGFSTFI